MCVYYFFMWFCSMQRKLYNHLTSILYEKHIHMRVLFHCEMCFSQNPMRYQVEDQKLWLIDESTGWWEEKKICGDSLKEALDKLHDVNLTDIMQQWVEPSLPSLQWQ